MNFSLSAKMSGFCSDSHICIWDLREKHEFNFISIPYFIQLSCMVSNLKY